MSSFQLEGIETFHPWIAVLLNFSPDHLDRHADLEEYAAAKARIFANQTPEDWALLNADDPASHALAQDARARRLLFATRADLPRRRRWSPATRSCGATGDGEQPLVPLSSVELLGRHLLADVVAAAAVASLAGVDAAGDDARAVENFTGLEHALEPVAEIGGVRFVNDSKATNVEAARARHREFRAGLVVLLGGRFKGGDFADLRAALVERSASVVAIGEAAPLVRAGARGGGRRARRRRHGGGGADRVRAGPPGRNGRARAGLRQLRHVQGLRGARPGLQAGGRPAPGRVGGDERALSGARRVGSSAGR